MKLAVIIPCLNEERTIREVIQSCHVHLPDADVYVLDNGSDDQTAAFAREAGARVIHSPLKGKGHVVRHAFRVIDADYFVLIDGDGTYPVEQAPRLIELAQTYNYEMVMGSRLELGRPQAFRPLHYFGNRLFTQLVRTAFGFPVRDLLTGFRVFSRRFTDHVRLVSSGFEIETELTIRAMAQNFAFCEVPIPYSHRPEGSHSKLRTFRDGWKILFTVVRLFKAFRPLLFFSFLALGSFGLVFITPGFTRLTFSFLSAAFLTLGFYLDSTLDLQRFENRAPIVTEQPTSTQPEKPYRLTS